MALAGAAHPGRIRVLNPGLPPAPSAQPGPVVYWMFRDQRCRNNWALIHAVDLANRSAAPVAVAFNQFSPHFLGACTRQLGFILRGLRGLSLRLRALRVPFFLLHSDAAETLPRLLCRLGASALRPVRASKAEIAGQLGAAVAVHEVDAHNVVPI